MKLGIRNRLLNLQDTEYQKFNKKLCPDTNREMLGIKMPAIRSLAKEVALSDSNWIEYVKDDSLEYFEEILIQGLIIGYSKLLLEDKF